jgi:hypothetical protein
MFSAILMGNRAVPRRFITFMYVVWTLSTLAVAGYGLANFTWQLMVASFVFNALEGAGTIVWATTKQRLVPNRLLGRVSSFDWFISTGLVPVSFALTGPVAEVLGSRTTLVGAGILGGIVTLAFLFLPGMRSVERESAMQGATLDAVDIASSHPGERPAPELAHLSAPMGSHAGEVALLERVKTQEGPSADALRLGDSWAFPAAPGPSVRRTRTIPKSR